VEGHLISGSDDKVVCLWDIRTPKQANGTLQMLTSFSGHTDVVEDVAWSHHHSHVFGSCGDDKHVILWDTRAKEKKITLRAEAHKAEVNCLAFNPFNEFMLVTGSADKTAALWDLRNMSKKMHSFESHVEQIFNVVRIV
jgi:histone-binding protein RBBP4